MSRAYYITITNERIVNKGLKIGLCLLEYALKTNVGIKTIHNAQSNIFVYYLFMLLSLLFTDRDKNFRLYMCQTLLTKFIVRTQVFSVKFVSGQHHLNLFK